MSYQSPTRISNEPIDAGRQLAQLRHVLSLVEELAGRMPASAGGDGALDRAALGSSSYCDALPIVRRRFDALAAETACWSAAAVEALLAAGEKRSRAAARRVADELQAALDALTSLLRP
jgi:predicted NBD/HSP70 family sugar kinase